jgi:hypothetical protein
MVSLNTEPNRGCPENAGFLCYMIKGTHSKKYYDKSRGVLLKCCCLNVYSTDEWKVIQQSNKINTFFNTNQDDILARTGCVTQTSKENLRVYTGITTDLTSVIVMTKLVIN